MFKRYNLSVIFTLFILFAKTSFAQNSFIISGRVVDQASGEALVGANIAITGTSIGVSSDRTGSFKLPALPAGTYTLEAGYIGYSTKTQVLSLESSDAFVTIELNQKPLSGPMVTVVATQAKERLTPVTFSSIDRKNIQNRYPVQDIPEVVSELPSTTFYSEGGHGLGYNYLSIRGFGQRRISVMVNGIPQNDPEDHNVYWVDVPDFSANVQSIQVQRGAGSAFYGPAAIGGSINIQTNYFSPQKEMKAFYGIGSFNTRKYSFSYNTGLLRDKYVVYTRASRIQSDGYRDRAWVDMWSYFVGAAMYNGNHNLRIHFYGGPIEDGLAYNGLPKFANDDDNLRRKNYSYWGTNDNGDSLLYYGDRRDDEIENFNQPHLEVLHEYKIAKNLNLNNSLFYIRGYGFFDYDGSWGTPEYYRLTPEYNYDIQEIPGDALIRAYVDNNQLGWLPQLTWNPQWGEVVIGAELRAHRSVHWGRLQKGSGLPSSLVGDGARRYYEYKGAKDIASLYFHQTAELWPKVFVMSDMQFTYKKYHLYDEKFVGNDFEVPYHFINPRIGVNYNATSKINFYASLSNTTREPRLKNLYDAAEASTPASWGAVLPQFQQYENGSLNFDEPLVKPETLTGIESGAGYRSARFNAMVNFYYMDFVDEIIKKGGLDRFGQPITGNADRTTHKGIEISSAFQLFPQLSLSGNVMYGKNELASYTVYGSDGEAQKLDGNPIAGFPDQLLNLRLAYSWNDVYASLGMKYVGKFYTDNFKNEANTVDPFTVVNLNLRYRLSKLGLKGFVLQARINNLLNKKYLAHGEGDAFFPAATRNGFVNLQYEL